MDAEEQASGLKERFSLSGSKFERETGTKNTEGTSASMAGGGELRAKQSMDQAKLNAFVGIRISGSVLERISREMIEVILYCLPPATRGTVYKADPIPELRVVRVASGHKDTESARVLWDEPMQSGYAYPGKVWEEYRDRPGRALEAMSWCIEKQMSWTSDHPEDNVRSMRKQLEGKAGEDYHHMEPVLIQKTDLWDMAPSPDAYPKNELGEPIWQDTAYATVAVIQIHFKPGTIRRGDRSTRIINRLSRSLGTQMVSFHARGVALEKQKRLARERQATCDALSHELRNFVPKIGFAYRAMNNEISYLRDSWESLLLQHIPEQADKRAFLRQLDTILKDMEKEYPSSDIIGDISRLSQYQKQLAESCLLPHQNEMWLQEKIRPLWLSILSKIDLEATKKGQIEKLLEGLRKSFHFGQDKVLRDKIKVVPEKLKGKWVDLAYREINGKTNGMIQQYIDLLQDIELDLPRKTQSLRNFVYLKALVELLPELEERLNHRLELIKAQ